MRFWSLTGPGHYFFSLFTKSLFVFGRRMNNKKIRPIRQSEAIRPDDRGLHTALLSISEGGLSGHGLSSSMLLFLQTFKVMRWRPLLFTQINVIICHTETYIMSWLLLTIQQLSCQCTDTLGTCEPKTPVEKKGQSKFTQKSTHSGFC